MRHVCASAGRSSPLVSPSPGGLSRGRSSGPITGAETSREVDNPTRALRWALGRRHRGTPDVGSEHSAAPPEVCRAHRGPRRARVDLGTLAAEAFERSQHYARLHSSECPLTRALASRTRGAVPLTCLDPPCHPRPYASSSESGRTSSSRVPHAGQSSLCSFVAVGVEELRARGAPEVSARCAPAA